MISGQREHWHKTTYVLCGKNSTASAPAATPASTRVVLVLSLDSACSNSFSTLFMSSWASTASGRPYKRPELPQQALMISSSKSYELLP